MKKTTEIKNFQLFITTFVYTFSLFQSFLPQKEAN
ncbi:hypothetical protein cce_2400 [Crocosphaera subtropica ATCC 51142]|uniref:Uncharacterized protein n=1 Tax=Crocosphaera subtropica (strain ATCC 51142 / BH68) TaxID=43989 RepID=B1WRA0_CROS5|nr:hypothetical protein cce_2400 [Crocosphaera subtropica ATCC 51142]